MDLSSAIEIAVNHTLVENPGTYNHLSTGEIVDEIRADLTAEDVDETADTMSQAEYDAYIAVLDADDDEIDAALPNEG